MKVTDLFFGAMAPVLSYTVVLVIVALMFVISIRLFWNRRKKAYLTMTVSLLVFFVEYALQLYWTLHSTDTSLAAYIALCLKLLSFVLVNMGIYQLYNPTRRRHFMLFYFLLAVGFFLSLMHIFVPEWYVGPENQLRLLQDIALELYIFVLIFLFFYVIPTFIGQQVKYQAALTVYFGQQLAHLVNAYMFDNQQPVLSLIGYALPAVYFFLLFMLLFDRVVELMQAIYNSSITDGLTKLYNRKFFYGRVNQYVQRHIPVSILFSDIDNFKKLNDTKGHQMGDEVLKQVAQIMKEVCEDCGIAGRYGGEEMVALITDASVSMEEFAETFRKRVEEESIVTVSVGFSTYKNGLSAEALIKQADEAMYKAKTSGKNKVVRYA